MSRPATKAARDGARLIVVASAERRHVFGLSRERAHAVANAQGGEVQGDAATGWRVEIVDLRTCTWLLAGGASDIKAAQAWAAGNPGWIVRDYPATDDLRECHRQAATDARKAAG